MAFDRRETILLILGDFCILAASLWIALTLRNFALPSFGYFEENLVPFLPMFLISLVVFYIAGLYEKQTRPIRRVMGVRIFGAQVATVAIAAILFFALPLYIEPKTILVLYLIVSVIAVSMWRFYSMNREMNDENRVPAILVGSGPAVLELYDEVTKNDRYLIRFIKHIDADGFSKLSIGTARVLIVDTAAIAKNLSLVKGFATKGITVRDFASLYEEIFDRVPIDHLDTYQFLESVSKRHSFYDGAKRVFDLVFAIVGICISLPVIGIAALALFIESGMPFFRIERIGKDGRIIHIVKLRSMLLNDHGDPELQKKNRVTMLGKFLRKTRIDELPQLWNILTGDLSFIGPRPEIPKIAEVYEREIPQYDMRHSITPGLSGWAQILDYDAPRGGADVGRTKRKLSFDLYYLKHRSFGLDLAIAIKTIRALLSFSGT
ncbi:MAG: sugar transferase [Candidatus Paceibacterota bacterium]|jgi:lipopolysaccharide/colanic/teichoic acid biosynthesis glycosyltransferase